MKTLAFATLILLIIGINTFPDTKLVQRTLNKLLLRQIMTSKVLQPEFKKILQRDLENNFQAKSKVTNFFLHTSD